MKISVLKYDHTPIDKAGVELIERKGIGHPDTLADMIAESFSNKYSRYTYKKFGVIANHYVDKVAVIGAKASVDFGRGEILKNIKVYLFGKVTSNVGDHEINIEKMFREVVDGTFKRVFKNKEILEYIDTEINVHDGRGKDHPEAFYAPKNAKELKKANKTLRSNDTVLCTGYAPYSECENLVIWLENYICSQKFKERFPATGYDVKVMLSRDTAGIDITICIPFIAAHTSTKKYYQSQLRKIEEDLSKNLKTHTQKRVTLHINTKDEGGKYAYLTVFGSAIDKGDQGAVGRGNRINGLITINREMNTEAPAGKNPLHHSGKIFNILACRMANKVSEKFNCQAIINISTRNGDILHRPHRVYVKVDREDINKQAVKKVIESFLTEKAFSQLTQSIILADPIKEHNFKSLLTGKK